MVDVELLEKTIQNRGLKKMYIAEQIGVDRSTFWQKMTRKAQFTIDEVEKITNVLSLSKKERDDIFFKK